MAQDLANVFTGETVLVADDDEVTREVLCALLTYAGLKVIGQVSTGEKALVLFLKHKPKIVCLDINMPGMSGLEVLSQIRSVSDRTVVLMVSGETTKNNLLNAISKRANGIVAKPFDFARVVCEIERALFEGKTSNKSAESTTVPEAPAASRKDPRRLTMSIRH